MYKKRSIIASIHDLTISENKMTDHVSQRARSLNSYIEHIEDKGLPEDAITCLSPNQTVDYPKSSSLWLKALIFLFEEDAEDVPNGVKLVEGKWLVPVIVITPCGKCKHPLQRGCKCILPER